MASTTAITAMIEMPPPRWSTGLVDSLTWLGTYRSAKTNATTANGMLIKKHDPHQKALRQAPASRGPMAAREAPMADHAAMARTRPGPLQRAVIKARVVG